jgi:bicarbonate transport system ATP-binding protein
VLGVQEDWAMAYPNTHIALIKAILDACRYCEDPENAAEVRQILARREYLSTDVSYIHLGDPNPYVCSLDHPMREYAHHRFFTQAGNRPSRTEHLWIMTQMARWGDTPFPRNWVEILERVCRVGAFSTAARELGINVNYSRSPIQLFDGVTFNSDDPIAYLNSLPIKHDVYMAEVPLDSPTAKLA